MIEPTVRPPVCPTGTICICQGSDFNRSNHEAPAPAPSMACTVLGIPNPFYASVTPGLHGPLPPAVATPGQTLCDKSLQAATYLAQNFTPEQLHGAFLFGRKSEANKSFGLSTSMLVLSDNRSSMHRLAARLNHSAR